MLFYSIVHGTGLRRVIWCSRLFLFIMGVTTYLSLSKLDFSPSWPVLRKILKRTFIILLIGWAIHWFDNGCSGKGWLDFSRLRITGVLTRIALCYGIVSVLALYLSRRVMLWLGAVLLVLYSAALCVCNGYVYDASNFNSVLTGHCWVPGTCTRKSLSTLRDLQVRCRLWPTLFLAFVVARWLRAAVCWKTV